jgi:transcription elongation factor GreA
MPLKTSIGDIFMIEEDVVYLTKDGLQKIKDELAYLKGEKRAEIAYKLEVAIAQGDLKENADYHAAKEEQGFVAGRIKDLEDSLRRAQIIKETGPSDKVRIGNTVTVTEEGYDDEETYYIVGAHEADPANGRISNESPIGRALIGAKVGQVVSVETPGGQIRLQLQTIS